MQFQYWMGLDEIGFLGPWIVTGITAIHLRNQVPYLISFVFFYVVNEQTNSFLKLWIRQDRPEGSRSIIDESYQGVHQYGMPSFHAQCIFYALTYFYWVKKSVPWTLGMMFIASLTLYQRWKYKNHTVEQLGVGSLVGMILATVGFYITKKYIESNKQSKLF
jgi:hypothetical protein